MRWRRGSRPIWRRWDMGDNWFRTTLGSIATKDGYGLVDGPFGSNLPASYYTDSGVPVIRGSNLSRGVVRFKADNFVFVSKETAQKLKRSLCKANDIVFTKKGSLGQTGLVPEDGPFEVYLLSSNQMKLTVDDSLADPKFVYYVVSSDVSVRKILQDADQTGVPKTNINYLKSFPINLPPLHYQHAIADVLGTLDEKIELNRQMNRTLEAMARAIFKAWFVDFEPVKAKAGGATSFRGMPQAIFDQLPHRFTDTELGRVPEGWGVKPIGDTLDVTMGQSPPSEYYNDQGEGLPFHQGVRDYGFRFPTHRVSCTLESRLADEGDVLISVRAPVGRINVANRRMVIGRGLAAAKHREGHSSYALYLLKHLFAVEDAVGDGTIYKAITKNFLLGMPVVSPPKAIVAECEKLLKPLDSLVETNVEATQTLAAIRDTLLPKLISGELPVGPPERSTAEAVCR
ncbi:MAG: restriction endonuclease subunit S [Spiribacter salinus]|uniref:Restriction endonuclease subunit S n=1 Tax=Spiribacter salinus TaxID=1335746 RepID=A0A540VR75_9GAMM|nr:MAG: restriction endonuclease subunit S [Spiribacter salinus]